MNGVGKPVACCCWPLLLRQELLFRWLLLSLLSLLSWLKAPNVSFFHSRDFQIAAGSRDAPARTLSELLSHSPDLLRTSLLSLDDHLVPAAVEILTQLLGFCGERAFSDPIALAETVQQCFAAARTLLSCDTSRLVTVF